MRLRAFTLTTVLLLLVGALLSQGCRLFSSSGCTQGGYLSGTVVRVSEIIEHTGCLTLRCPRLSSYDVTADSNGNIHYSRDEDGNCISSKLTFTIVGFSLTSFSNLSGSINLNAPPSSVTIGGSGIDTTYGMPIMALFDYNGTFIGQETAQATSGDGTWAQFNVPSLTNPYSGTYHAKVAILRWDGKYEEVGDAPIDCYGLPLVDADGDGVYVDQDCNDGDPNISPLAPADCSGYYWDANCNGIADVTEYACTSGGGGDGGGGDGCIGGECLVY